MNVSSKPYRWFSLLIVSIALSMLLIGCADTAQGPSAITDTPGGNLPVSTPTAVLTPSPPMPMQSPTTSITNTASSSALPAWFHQVVEETRHFKGAPNAPVTMIEFSDFQCPYCSRFTVETFPGIEERYIQEGIVRVGYRHAAFQGEGSIRAAEASECAADQGAFWAYHDRLIKRLAVEQKRDFTPETLKQFAAELNLDTTTFASCLDEGRYTTLVKNETRSAQDLGVSGTPTFLINGRRLVGAQPLASFEQAIRAAQSGEPIPEPPQAAERADETPTEEITDEEVMAMLVAQAHQMRGSPGAPVTMIIFSDFQCIYCGRFALEAGKQIDETYVASGTVRVGYIHAAYHGEEAMLAAEASECAGDQDAFWQYHDRLFDQLVLEQNKNFPVNVLKQIAADLHLDTEAFNTCLDQRTYRDLIQSQTAFAQQIGVTGTPAFILNGKGVMGAQPFEVFQEIIDAER